MNAHPPRLAEIAAASLLGASAIFAAPLAAASPSLAETATLDATERFTGYADVIEPLLPAVVNVLAERETDRRRLVRGGGLGQGSGFVVEPDGLIVTNAHVVRGADRLSVTTHDGATLDAELLGVDEQTDLAVLKVEPDHPLAAVAFADEPLRVGDVVLAVGNPFGLGGTVTAGIVSAAGREIGAGPHDDFVQIDAPINAGNSGGPAFNLDGEVVGVNTAIFSPSGGNVGIGFAIPAERARAVVADLADDGRVDRGWLGVSLQAIDDDLAKALGLSDRGGALITEVIAGSPAAEAELEPGDAIVALNGAAIASPRDLARAIADAAPDAQVEIARVRDGERASVRVRLDRLESDRLAEADPGAEKARIGLALAPLRPRERARSGLADGGALVARIAPDGSAARKGVRPGDVIAAVDGEPIAGPGDVAERVAAAAAAGESSVVLDLRRGENRLWVATPIERG